MLFMACYEFSFFVCYVFLWLRLLCPANGLHADLPLQKMHKPCPWIAHMFYYIYFCIRASSSGQVSCSLNMLCASGTLVYSWLPFPILLAFSYHREMEVPACLLTVRCSNFLQLMVTHGRLC